MLADPALGFRQGLGGRKPRCLFAPKVEAVVLTRRGIGFGCQPEARVQVQIVGEGLVLA